MSVPRPKGERAEWGPPRPAPFGVHRILTRWEVLPIRMQAMATRTRPEPVAGLLNRELSHLEFHARVLELATDESLPLLERVNYCSIFSSNLDEFFQVHVAGLLGQAEAGVTVRSADGLTPQQTLARIRQRVLELSAMQARLWKRELRPALATEGITVGGIEDLGGKELAELERRFHREIYPVLTPLAVGPGQPFPYISGLSLSLAIFAEHPETGEERFARVKIPEGLPRFFELGGRGLYVPLEQIIAHFLPSLFPGVDILERAYSASPATLTSRSPTTPTTSSRPWRASCADAASETSYGSR